MIISFSPAFQDLAKQTSNSSVSCSHVIRLIIVRFGPCEKVGSSVWEWEFYSGRHRISKRIWNIEVVEVIKKERNQAIFLAVGRKCRRH